MNAPVDAATLAKVSLDDKYTLDAGRVYLDDRTADTDRGAFSVVDVPRLIL